MINQLNIRLYKIEIYRVFFAFNKYFLVDKFIFIKIEFSYKV